MLDWSSLFLLVAQAMLTIIAVEQLRRQVFPRLGSLRDDSVFLDVWSPLALVIPMLFLAAKVNGSVEGIGWLPVGAPVLCGLFGVGAALLVRREEAAHQPGSRELWKALATPRVIGAWTGAGLLLLLLGAAHYLTLWMGQCVLAIAAVLLWLNTPDEPPSAAEAGPASRAGGALMIALLCAIGQGVIALRLPMQHVPLSGGLMVAQSAMVLAAAARYAGAGAAARIGGWAATFGVFLGLGLLSAMRLVPEAIRAAVEGQAGSIHRIAFGFGAYWFEAVIMLMLAGATLMLLQAARVLQRLCGFMLILAAAGLAAWRLSGIP